MGNDCVGSVKDIGAGAVILLQADGLHVWKIFQEVLYMLNFGTTPAVDGLIVIADGEDVASVIGKDTHKRVLDGVGILEFVDQNLTEARTVVCQ